MSATVYDETWSAESPAVDAVRVWQQSPRRAVAGETYLEARGLDVGALLARELVRFDVRSGAPCLALRHLAIGDAVVNVVRRSLPSAVFKGFPKTLGLTGCPTLGALVGNVDHIRIGSDVVVCEGVIDTLTAALAWPHALVFGAHGALRMPDIAHEVSRRTRKARGRFYLCVHADKTGERYAEEAGLLAMQAGLALDRDLLLVDHGDAKDLNEAWQQGWRP